MATKASRISERLFKDVPRLDTKRGMFSPLHWAFRTVIREIPIRTWQIYTYILMRSGPEGLSWQTDRQIGHDCNIGPRKVAQHIRELEKLGVIVTKEHEGTRYICVADPLRALSELSGKGALAPLVVQSLHDDLLVMQPKLKAPPEPPLSEASPEGST
jgi:hypothetical protein